MNGLKGLRLQPFFVLCKNKRAVTTVLGLICTNLWRVFLPPSKREVDFAKQKTEGVCRSLRVGAMFTARMNPAPYDVDLEFV